MVRDTPAEKDCRPLAGYLRAICLSATDGNDPQVIQKRRFLRHATPVVDVGASGRGRVLRSRIQ